MSECPECGARLRKTGGCRACNWTPSTMAGRREPEASPYPTRCPYDGAALTALLYCERGGGYPAGDLSRDSGGRRASLPRLFDCCPICRGRLDWSGGCDRCHGSRTAERDSWTFPGDRYDTHDDDGKPLGDGVHWVRTDGPRAALSVAQAKAAARLIQTLAARMTAPDGGEP